MRSDVCGLQPRLGRGRVARELGKGRVARERGLEARRAQMASCSSLTRVSMLASPKSAHASEVWIRAGGGIRIRTSTTT